MIKLIKQIVLCLAVSGVGFAEVSTLDLPDIGDSTGSILAPEYERRLGQAFLNHIRKQTDIITDPEIESYIQSIGYRLVSHSDNNTQGFTFFVINDPLINAFAAPGGIVGINAGVILNADTESELAGVLAHEIAHVTQKHMARSAEMSQKLSIPMMAAMLGAILIATQDAEAGQAAIAAVQGGATQARINFTRDNEKEADRVGMQLLTRAEFNPRGMTNFFEKLQRNSRFTAQAPEFLRTHPLTTNRIADSQARAATYPIDFKYHESRTFKFIQAKLIVMAHKEPEDAVNFYRDLLQQRKFHDDTMIYRYGYALALTRAGEYDKARERIRALLAQEKENISFMLAAANIEVQSGNYQDAIRIYSEAEKLYPDYRPLVLNYAKTLQLANYPEQAKDLLKDFGKYHTPDLNYYEQLARVQYEAGEKVESGIANAEYYYLSGETRVAIERLKYVLRQRNPRPDYYQEERIYARLAFLEQELQIERDLKLAR